MSAQSPSNPRHQVPLRCDCCKNLISLEDKDHAQNNPCGHNICFPCFIKSTMKRSANPASCQVKDCPQKYAIISCQYFNRGMPGEIIDIETIVELGTDEVASILAFLPLEKIICLRGVNMAWRDAAKKTIVPLTCFAVEDMNKYRAMRVMARVLPNLQQINIGYLGWGDKYNDGEDPDEEEAARTANQISHDIEIISNFRKLRILDIDAPLNGRYPVLFNSFPLLQKLSFYCCIHLKWDLGMLAGMSLLKELECLHNHCLTGNISSLRLLKDSLEKVLTRNCKNIEGSLMDLADLPHLKELNLDGTAVTGDIRDIGENDFSSLEHLTLPKSVYGCSGYVFQRISDASDLVRAVYLFKKQRPALIEDDWYGVLSEASPDWYDSAADDDDTPPFYVRFVKAGPRIGYRWETEDDMPCEVIWLDPEPESGTIDYYDYASGYQRIQGEFSIYRGYYEPPTEEQYTLLYEEHVRIQSDDEDY